jgi:hypothetical protein
MITLVPPASPRDVAVSCRGARTVVEPGPGGPSVLVMRDDTAYVVHELGKRLTGRSALPWQRLSGVLRSSYALFQHDVRAELARSAARPGEVEFHLVDAVALEHAVRRRTAETPVISLDPLFPRAQVLRLSRGFLLGGTRSAGLVARPYAQPIVHQLAALARSLRGVPCSLVEDDVYTGGTLREAIRLLHAADVQIARVVPGIRVITAAGDKFDDVAVDSAIEYRVPDLAALNLADPRNFLLGVSGLVVRLPDRTWGRAPYWQPFVSAAARVGITSVDDRAFALAMVDANACFFARVESRARCLVRVGDLHPSVRRLFVTLRLAEESTPVRTVVDWLGNNLDRLTESLRAR